MVDSRPSTPGGGAPPDSFSGSDSSVESDQTDGSGRKFGCSGDGPGNSLTRIDCTEGRVVAVQRRSDMVLVREWSRAGSAEQDSCQVKHQHILETSGMVARHAAELGSHHGLFEELASSIRLGHISGDWSCCAGELLLLGAAGVV